MPEQYKRGERLRVAVEGVLAEDAAPGERLTLRCRLSPHTTSTTVCAVTPSPDVTVERLIPADGEPRPNEVWRDHAGVDRWAYLDSRSGEMCLIGPDGVRNDWRHFNIMYGPLTRVHPPVSAAPAAPAGQEETAPGEPVLTLGDRWRDRDGAVWTVAEENGQLGLKYGADWGTLAWVNARYGPLTPITSGQTVSEQAETREPRLMLGDRWEDCDEDIWRVTANLNGELRLTLGHGDGLSTWTDVTRDYAPLRLVQRAGYRPTGGTVPTERLNSGMVVSCPDWVGGAPVRLTAPADGTERAYELLGDGEAGVGVAGPGALFTVWEPAGGAS